MKYGIWPLWQVITSSLLGAIVVTIISLRSEEGTLVEGILIFCLSSVFLLIVFFSSARLFNALYRRWHSPSQEQT
ncbi:hypothetical protein D9543_10045 [Corynebacterium macginleyi]|uniref:Uncharacterized protein n=1 Tax=Corynebacterium macginleyi TaxID=38290 RepID=A0A3M0FXI1_9CORY|nr:hypothetical protein D9543_10045 [Corynebacterium macginleyi]RMB65018.1 hypothetical protein D9V82_09630 [Corynebacterium macginleyi]RMB66674.1 hypothetical protein D9542_08115 [Corynebacterium macginleyi]